MRWSHSIILPSPATDVLSLEEAKRELDVTHNEDDALITSHIASAVDWVQKYTGRFLAPTVVDLLMDEFPSVIELPFAPVSSVGAINYADPSGNLLAIAPGSYRAIAGEPFRIIPAIGQRWPYAESGYVGAVSVRATFGYAAGEAPANLLQAVRTVLNLFYEKPDNIPGGHATLWDTAERCARPSRFMSL